MYGKFVERQDELHEIKGSIEKNLRKLCSKVREAFPELDEWDIINIIFGRIQLHIFLEFYEWHIREELKKILGKEVK